MSDFDAPLEPAPAGHHDGAAVPPGSPPREVTPAVRRRAWTEPRVRTWWILALGVLLLTLYVILSQAAGWWSERKLITDGVQVQGVVVRAADRLNDITVPDKSMPPDSVCEIEFDWKGGKHRVRGQLPGHLERGEYVVTGPAHPVALRVDPDDPDRWTDRKTSPPLLARQLIPVVIGLPIVAVLGLLASLKRGSAARVWRDGQAAMALVVGTGQSPFAPRSRALRCTAAESSDKRVFTVFLPAGAAPLTAGDAVWVVRPPDRPEPAYAAGWFERDDVVTTAQPAEQSPAT